MGQPFVFHKIRSLFRPLPFILGIWAKKFFPQGEIFSLFWALSLFQRGGAFKKGVFPVKIGPEAQIFGVSFFSHTPPFWVFLFQFPQAPIFGPTRNRFPHIGGVNDQGFWGGIKEKPLFFSTVFLGKDTPNFFLGLTRVFKGLPRIFFTLGGRTRTLGFPPPEFRTGTLAWGTERDTYSLPFGFGPRNPLENFYHEGFFYPGGTAHGGSPHGGLLIFGGQRVISQGGTHLLSGLLGLGFSAAPPPTGLGNLLFYDEPGTTYRGGHRGVILPGGPELFAPLLSPGFPHLVFSPSGFSTGDTNPWGVMRGGPPFCPPFFRATILGDSHPADYYQEFLGGPPSSPLCGVWGDQEWVLHGNIFPLGGHRALGGVFYEMI